MDQWKRVVYTTYESASELQDATQSGYPCLLPRTHVRKVSRTCHRAAFASAGFSRFGSFESSPRSSLLIPCETHRKPEDLSRSILIVCCAHTNGTSQSRIRNRLPR